jgi:16S rRNA (cytidine1402-2'-O)-methyltransferase
VIVTAAPLAYYASDMDTTGTLLLVATPIGNLGDISRRAIATLRTVDAIYCEDTRRSRQLLTHLEIQGQQLISLREHNEAQRTGEILQRLAAGQRIALISDAGMPVVSDPGQRLVAAVAEAGYTVTAIPGANAAVMALAISGLPAEHFRFEGFLPVRGQARQQRLEAVAQSPETTILYEAPQRLARTVADLLKRSGKERPITIVRELTKLHEEVWRGSLEAAQAYVSTQPPRGEYTLVVAGAAKAPELITDDKITTALKAELSNGASRRDAIGRVAAQLGLPRARVYTLAHNL